jgi:hypothetical protein
MEKPRSALIERISTTRPLISSNDGVALIAHPR